MKLSDLIDKAEAKGACEDALAELRNCATLESVLAHPSAGKWAVWAWEEGVLPISLLPALRDADMAYDGASYTARARLMRRSQYPWSNHHIVRHYIRRAFQETERAAARKFAQAIYDELKD